MNSRTNWHIADTRYPAIRLAMDETRMNMDDEQLEDYIEELIPGTHPEEVENFMRSLQRIGRQVAPIAQRALPGMIQGAVQGGSVAGPWGALAGALGGGAASLLSGGGQGGAAAPQQRAPAPQPTPAPVPQTGAGAAPAAGSVSMAHIQQLLALISRPETMQALSALLMSRSGRSSVPVGGRSVPAAAFANAISEIAADVAEAAADFTTSEDISEYLIDAEGQLRGDVVNPTERARLLLDDICRVATEEFYEEEYEDEDDMEDDIVFELYDDEDDDEYYDVDPLDDYEQAMSGGY